MPRALFEKTGNAVWISHLDLMRLFQRAFKRAGLSLTHTQGFNPRPSVSIALPLSVGVESHCELLDFELETVVPCDQIKALLNENLVEGVRILSVYEDGAKLKHLALLDCTVKLEYDNGIPEGTEEAISALFAQKELFVEKKGKNGTVEQNIIPMIRKLTVRQENRQVLCLDARICCQNPTLNPVQLSSAIAKYASNCTANFVSCCRLELYDEQENVFR
jgi:radical SAM-linked protein